MEAQVSERAPDGVGEFGSVASTGCAGARVGFPFCWRCVPVLASTRFVGVARGVDASPCACRHMQAAPALTCSCARRASRACFRRRIRAPGIFPPAAREPSLRRRKKKTKQLGYTIKHTPINTHTRVGDHRGSARTVQSLSYFFLKNSILCAMGRLVHTGLGS